MEGKRKPKRGAKDYSFAPLYEKEFSEFLENTDKDIKLNGLYVSHKFSRNLKGGERLTVFYKCGSDGFTEYEDVGERKKFWHDKRNELWEERDKHSEKDRLYDELDKRGDYAELKWLQYHEAFMDAHAGLPIAKYWEGKYVEERSEQPKQRKGSKPKEDGTRKKSRRNTQKPTEKVSLQTAWIECDKEAWKKGVYPIAVCIEYIETHEIIGKKGYTAQQLSHRIAVERDKAHYKKPIDKN